MGEDTDDLPSVWDGAEHVPVKAYDVGDVGVRENPRAGDLGYVEGGDTAVARNFRGDSILYDERNGAARVECDSDTFIEDVSVWA